MPEQLLTLLKLCLLALLYLFFLRVLRAVWAEVNAPRAGRGRRGARGQAGAAARRPRPARAASNHPQLRWSSRPSCGAAAYALGEEITLGRAAGCQVTLDDTYASQLHARVFQRDGQLVRRGPRLHQRHLPQPAAGRRARW